MAQQLLDRANVVAALQQVSGEGVAERLAGRGLRDSRRSDRVLHRPLDGRFMEVMSPLAARVRIHVQAGRWKDILPTRLAACIRILSLQGTGKRYPARAARQIPLVRRPHTVELASQRGRGGGGQERVAIAMPLGPPHSELVPRKVEVLDSNPQRLE